MTFKTKRCRDTTVTLSVRREEEDSWPVVVVDDVASTRELIHGREKLIAGTVAVYADLSFSSGSGRGAYHQQEWPVLLERILWLCAGH